MKGDLRAEACCHFLGLHLGGGRWGTLQGWGGRRSSHRWASARGRRQLGGGTGRAGAASLYAWFLSRRWLGTRPIPLGGWLCSGSSAASTVQAPELHAATSLPSPASGLWSRAMSCSEHLLCQTPVLPGKPQGECSGQHWARPGWTPEGGGHRSSRLLRAPALTRRNYARPCDLMRCQRL